MSEREKIRRMGLELGKRAIEAKEINKEKKRREKIKENRQKKEEKNKETGIRKDKK